MSRGTKPSQRQKLHFLQVKCEKNTRFSKKNEEQVSRFTASLFNLSPMQIVSHLIALDPNSNHILVGITTKDQEILVSFETFFFQCLQVGADPCVPTSTPSLRPHHAPPPPPHTHTHTAAAAVAAAAAAAD